MYLLIIRRPDATGDLTLQVNLWGPVSLPADRANQHKAIPVRDEGLSAIMGPGEVTHLDGRQFTLQAVCVYIQDAVIKIPLVWFFGYSRALPLSFVHSFVSICSRIINQVFTWAPLSFTNSTDHLPSYWIHTKIPPSISQVASFWKGSFQRTKTTCEQTQRLFYSAKPRRRSAQRNIRG